MDEDSDQADGDNVAGKEKCINMKTIAETVIGLKTYEDSKIDDKKLIEYVDYTESHNNPKLSFWACVCAVLLFVINVYGI